MRLDDLLTEDLLPQQAAVEINGVTDDSRLVRAGSLFVAIPGLSVDGHDFVAAAVANGAAAVVAQRPLSLEVPCIVVSDSAAALGWAAARFNGQPSSRLSLLGITGTNGKTTTTYIIEAILSAAGRSPGVIGTVSYRFGDSEQKAPFTTPTPTLLQPLLSRMVDAGCDWGVMEVSSHALQLGRVWGCEFAVAAFSHLSQDHLDLHGDMASYRAAKARLFSDHLRADGIAVINIDGEGHEAMLAAAERAGTARKILRCSRGAAEADVALTDERFGLDGMSATLRLGQQTLQIHSPLIGAFNADNLLLAIGCCHAAGVDAQAIEAGIAAIPQVPGRLERVMRNPAASTDPTVVVDYAHTPDALVRAIDALRPLCHGRLIVVFGCGGDRDQAKRPLMGQAVVQRADLALITSDNPRTEDPRAIIDAIVAGVSDGPLARLHDQAALRAKRGYWIELERRDAIRLAIAAANPDDLVLIAGKGHEDYQILGTERIHFDDRQQAREALAWAEQRS